MASNGNVIAFSSVIVLPGTQAPTAAQSPLIMRPYDQELVLCKRYWQTTARDGTPAGLASILGTRSGIFSSSGNFAGGPFSFETEMRAIPTAGTVSIGLLYGHWEIAGGSPFQAVTANVDKKGFSHLSATFGGPAAGALVYGHWIADARL
jgi:hypothetical protein